MTKQKVVKLKKLRVSRTPKPRNANTMTESSFWGFIRSALRQKSRWWKPVQLCKINARRQYKGPNKRQKFEYQCNICRNWFPERLINVDHKIPAGTLRCSEDLPLFVEKLFCEADGLQCLCSSCHDAKTKSEKLKNKNQIKNPK